MQELIIYGSGGHASVIIDAVEKQGEFRIKGLIDDYRKKGDSALGYNILGGCGCLKSLLEAGAHNIFIAVGDNSGRRKLTEYVLGIGFNLISVIHPFSSVGRNACLDKGVAVLHGAVVDQNVFIGRGVIININACVAHNSRIGDFTHISAGVNFGANAHIGNNSFVGMGATVISDIQIGENVYIGAGSVVTKHIPDNVKAIGFPARIIKDK